MPPHTTCAAFLLPSHFCAYLLNPCWLVNPLSPPHLQRVRSTRARLRAYAHMLRIVSGRHPLCNSTALQRRWVKVNNSSTLQSVSSMMDETSDNTSKKVYAKKRQQDAIAWAQKEKEQALRRVQEQLNEQSAQPSDAGKTNKPTSYTKSMDAFRDRTIKLQHSFTGLAENRVIAWWEELWYNWIRYFFTRESLIAKDRYGNRFCVRWNFIRGREESRLCYRCDSNKKHQPYGALATDERQWERWMRGHRGDPPSVAEEEHFRAFKKQYFGPIVVGDEEVEDTMMRIIAHTNRSSAMMNELDDDRVYPDTDRTLKPLRHTEPDPGREQATRAEKHSGTTWTMGFVRGDLFYNEEEVQVMRTELGHVFRNIEWQELEYKRHIRTNNPQKPVGKPPEGNTDPNVLGDPVQHKWHRTDLGVPHYDAVPDLTTPELERLRIESDQLEDERLAIRKELGLTDLGDIREGRPPIKQDHDDTGKFQPPPVSKRWKPKTWEENWGTCGGNRWC